MFVLLVQVPGFNNTGLCTFKTEKTDTGGVRRIREVKRVLSVAEKESFDSICQKHGDTLFTFQTNSLDTGHCKEAKITPATEPPLREPFLS